MGHKGHWGEYTGNAKWSKDHAHTKVTDSNYKASEKDDAAHIDYLKRDIKDDQKFHVKDKDEKQTADEKHISKLAGDMKYDKEHHGSPAKNVGLVMDAARHAKRTVNDAYNYAHEDDGYIHDPKFTPGQTFGYEDYRAPGGYEYENLQAMARHADMRNRLGYDTTMQKEEIDMMKMDDMPIEPTGHDDSMFKQ